MLWMIVAVMAFEHEDGSKDYHIWPEPAFSSQIECKRWGAENLDIIHQSLQSAYPTKDVELIFVRSEHCQRSTCKRSTQERLKLVVHSRAS